MINRLIGVVVLVISLGMVYFAFNLPFGSFRRPGPGLYPLLLALALTLLTLPLFLSLGDKPSLKKIEEHQPERLDLRKVFYVIGDLLVYAFCFQKLGFLLSTFIFFLLLKPVVQKSWRLVVMGAILVSLGSYLIFGIVLEAQLPKGIFGI